MNYEYHSKITARRIGDKNSAVKVRKEGIGGMNFNKNYYRAMSFILIACLFLISFNLEVSGAESGNINSEKYNLDNNCVVNIEEAEYVDSDGYHALESEDANLNNISSEEKNVLFRSGYKNAGLPSYYNSKDYNHVTNIRNQRSNNLCWAFAAIGAVESACLSQGLYEGTLEEARENLNLSEKDFAYYYFNRKGHNDVLGNTDGDYTAINDPEKTWNMLGGNDMMAIWYMLNWEAPSNENKSNDSETDLKQNPDFPKGLDDNNYFDCDYHVQNARFFKKSEVDKIKEHIMEYGAVMASYTASNASGEQNAKYQYNPSDYPPNHAVIIVGWDDTIDKELFKTKNYYKPEIDGGWLIKNSWGENVGDDLEGYQWISYDDKTIGEFIGIECEDKDNYDNMFYYDGATGCDHTSVTYKTTSYDTYFYNIFTNNTKFTQNVKAVGLGISDLGMDDGSPAECQIQVYKNPEPGVIESGIPMLHTTMKKNFSENGYYTIKLGQDILIEPGESFKVLYHFNTPTSLYVDQATSPEKRNWFSCSVGEESGAAISYVNNTDLSTLKNRPTLRIKAYTNNVINLDDAQIETVPDFVYDKTKHEPDIAVTVKGVKLIRDRDYSLTFTDSVNAGVVTYTIQGMGDCKGTRTGTFKINKRNVSITALDAKIPKGNIIEKYIYEIKGLIKGDYFKEGKEPTISCNATVSSNVGTYPIKITVSENALGDNYIINTFDGTLTIIDGNIDYVVTFDTGKIGTAPKVLKLKYGDPIGEPDKPTAKGYIFSGWYKDKEYKESFDFENAVISGYDITVYAKWEEIKYNIVYKSNTNESLKEFEEVKGVPYFDTYTVLNGDLYKRSDYMFMGWSKNPDDATPVFKAGDFVNGDTLGVEKDNDTVILYAIWKNNKLPMPKADIDSGAVDYGTAIKLYCETEGTSIYYIEIPENASEEEKNSIPDKNSKLYFDVIRIKENVTIKAYAVKDGCSDSDIAVFEYDVNLDQGEIEDDDLDKYCEEGIPKGIWIAGGPTDEEAPLVYDGQKQSFDINVYDFNKKLVSGKDYKATFKNNRNACEDLEATHAPRVVVKGKGMYSGTIEKAFVIEKKSLDATNDNLKPLFCCYDNATYKGQKISIDIFSSKGKKLKIGKEYTCTFYKDENCTEEIKSLEVGDYYAKVEGIGNYKGSIIVQHHIVSEGSLMKDAKVKGISKNLSYDDGNEVSQNKLTVSHKNIGELTEGVDYTLRYFNNDEVGNAKVIITALPSDKKIYGSKCISYKIKGIPLNKCKIEKFWVKEDKDDEYPFVYEGDEITVDVEISRKDKAGELIDLSEDIDYIVSYKNNKEPGKATVYIKGIGNYYGTVCKTFTIKKANINEFNIEYNKVAEYEKNGAKPEINVTAGSVVLKKDKDYTVIYKNNKTVTDVTTGKGAPSIIIKGAGNYCGVIKKIEGKALTYSIIPRNMKTTSKPLDVVVEDVVKGDNIKPIPKVFDTDNAMLEGGFDYSEEYKYVLENTNEAVGDISSLPLGTVVDVIVSGMGNYEGKAVGKFRIVEKSISNATAGVSNKQVYDRDGTKVKVDDIIIELDGVKLIPGVDFEIKSYENNTKTGKAFVTVHGIGKYGGFNKVSFVIDKKDLGTDV